jgi:hypothetical protein
MHGSSIGNTNGNYGTRCVSSSVECTAARFENRAAWTDDNGNFWMFGGTYKPGLFTIAGLNDLWMYCVGSNEWTWISGDSLANQPGSGNTKGVSSPLNKPSPRNGPYHGDTMTNLYVWGGTDPNFGNMYNDLWKLPLIPACTTSCAMSLPVASPSLHRIHVCPRNMY